MKSGNHKKLNRVIQNYSPVYQADSIGPHTIFKGRVKKNEQKINVDNGNKQFIENIKKIHRELEKQQKKFAQNTQNLLIKIEEYYIKISKKLQSQRHTVEDSLREQFVKTQKVFNENLRKFQQIQRYLYTHNKTVKNAQSIYQKLGFLQLPTFKYTEPQMDSLNIIIATLNPSIQFITAQDQDQHIKTSKLSKFVKQNKLKPPFAYIGPTQNHNLKQNDKKKNQQNSCKDSKITLIDQQQQHQKTAIKQKDDHFLTCDQAVEQWKYNTYKSKKDMMVDDVIVQESQSKQSSLVSQQIF